MAKIFVAQRVQFPQGKQHFFLKTCQQKLHITTKQLANILECHVRTLNDWKKEKYLMPLSVVKQLFCQTGILPHRTKIRDKYKDVSSAARLAGLAVYKKYGDIGGDPERRKVRWRQWWEKKGKFLPHPILGRRKSIRMPRKSSLLAEFIGIMLGDGGISKRQITVTLHSKDDYVYSLFVQQLLKKLFGITPSVYQSKHDQALRIFISRTNLVVFCRKLGLKIGHKIKQGLDIPPWVHSQKKFQKSCIRGLIDTDGSLVIHRYKVNGRQYIYKKLNFTSASPFLINSVISLFLRFGFRIRKDKSGRKLWLDDQSEVRKYMTVIGTNNPKHQERFLR